MDNGVEQPMAGRTVLVTGHTGFLGAWLCLLLQRLGAEVVGASRRRRGGAAALLGLDALPVHPVDLTVLSHVEVALAGVRPDAIVHTAAIASVAAARADPYRAFVVNGLGTASVIEAARRTGVGAVAVAETWFPVSDEGPLDAYIASKRAGQLAARSVGGDEVAVGRVVLPNLVGGGDGELSRLVPGAVDALARGEEPVVRDPAAVRRWAHVLDAGAALTETVDLLLDGAGGTIRDLYTVAPEASVGDVIGRLRSLWEASGPAPAPGGTSADPGRDLVWDLDEALRHAVEAARRPDELAETARRHVDEFVEVWMRTPPR